MASFPAHSWCLLVRTDLTDDSAWLQVVADATRPSPEGFQARVQPHSDPALDGADWEVLRDAAMTAEQPDYASVLFVADATTLRGPEHPILVTSTSRFHRESCPDEFAAMRPFRCVPEWLWSVENNLDLAHLDRRDFAGHVDGAGVFRGF